MKPINFAASLAIVALTLPCGCSDHDSYNIPPPTSAGETNSREDWSGKVIETMDAGGYTYIQVETGTEKIWAATEKTPVKVGEKVSFSNAMPMQDFTSKTLKRKFDLIYFVPEISTPRSSTFPKSPHGPRPATNITKNHSKATSPGEKIKLDFSGLKKPSKGYTVAEIYAEQKNLSGKTISFRGKVAKFSAMIMKKNWLHIQDGTGAEGTNDITVTTTAKATVGDTVLIKGKIALNKDFGYGYKYTVIVEEATVLVEKEGS